ncbi:type III-A CRISPR-associated protein Cas10/Csm1 [bacterium]|nr:type III-A CRISPR-associated protein Cas10/Csm1 [bacterium]
MESYYQAVLGALLHDIGKLVQRKDEHTRKHSDVGEDFLKEHLPLWDFFSPIPSFVGEHHEKKDIAIASNKAFLAIVKGDLIAAGERESRDDENKGKPKTDSLVPIAARIQILSRDKSALSQEPVKDIKWGFPIKDGNTVQFPKRNAKLSCEDYEKMSEGLAKGLSLLKRSYNNCEWSNANIESYIVSVMALLRRYTSYIPSATYWAIPDISLYEHSRIAAAIAGCWVLEHDDENQFLYFSGDISGIQKFIYSITSRDSSAHKSFSKRLRGRSFYISLLTDGIAHFIIKRLKLSEPHLLLSGGGNFSIILPNSDKMRDALDKVISGIDSFLWENFYGNLALVTHYEKTNEQELVKNFDSLLEKMKTGLEQGKKRKLSKIMGNFPLVFDNDGAEDICPSCGVDVTEKNTLCQTCKLQEKIGTLLPKAKYLFFIPKQYNISNNEKSVAVPFGDMFSWVLSESDIPPEKLYQGTIRYHIDSDVIDDFLGNGLSPAMGYSYRRVGKYLPTDERGLPLALDDISKEAMGAEYLGVVRMDVDDMGAIFSLGMSQQKKRKHPSNNEDKEEMLSSISRFSQLSRSLNTFFSDYLIEMLREWGNDRGKHIYLGYSGGDDLFYIASWDTAIDVAREISAKFKEYMCKNPAFHLSGGMVLVKPQYPVAKSSVQAGEKEERAKDNQ